MKTLITKEDILAVATQLKCELTEKEIVWALLNYESYEREDPGATWNLIVEQIISDLKSN